MKKSFAIYEKKITKFEKDLEAMIKVIKSGRLKGEKKNLTNSKRIKAKNPGFNKLVDLQINDDFTQVCYSRKKDAGKMTSGCYIISYDKINADAEQIWRIYTTFDDSGKCFSCDEKSRHLQGRFFTARLKGPKLIFLFQFWPFICLIISSIS